MKRLSDLNIPAEVKEDIETITNALLENYFHNISKIILFGSYATGKYQADSDIDIAVALNELPPMRERRLYKRTAESVERDVDLLFCTNEQLSGSVMVYKRINEQGVLLYDGNNARSFPQ